ncbi:hypothetical protein AB0D32_07585 [Micromonospora sp. NPDC048170]|uniref:hypothetical protein n=1 Tax=Micromonospora sp. NPDC048170 TaxID=3154819 RepID=UPI0033E5C14B
MSTSDDEQVEGVETVVTAVDENGRADVTPTDTPKHVVVLSLIHRPSPRLISYVQSLAGRGDEVELFTTRLDHWHEVEDLDPRIRLYALDRPEEQLFVRRVERALVFRGPKAVATAVKRAADQPWGGPLRRPADVVSRAQAKVSGAVHKRIFMPPYRAFRPRLLARRFDQGLRNIDFSGVDLVVATDVFTVTAAARLARRYPGVRVTTAMEL